MKVVIRKDSFKEVHNQILPTMEKHFHEISFYAERARFKPDLEKYFFYEENNVLLFFTANYASNIIGYAAYIIHKHAHCDITQAYQDVFYVDKEHRRNGIGSDLIDYCDEYLKKFGCDSVFTSVSTHHNFGKLYLDKNYRHIENQFARWL